MDIKHFASNATTFEKAIELLPSFLKYLATKDLVIPVPKLQIVTAESPNYPEGSFNLNSETITIYVKNLQPSDSQLLPLIVLAHEARHAYQYFSGRVKPGDKGRVWWEGVYYLNIGKNTPWEKDAYDYEDRIATKLTSLVKAA